MTKSYVTLEQQQCLVCGNVFDTGSLLLDRRLRERFEMHTVTGAGLCPEHESLHKRGFVALVECDQEKTSAVAGIVQPEDAHRTGVIMHIRRRVWEKIFDSEAPDSPMVFMEIGVIDKLKEMGIAPEES